MELSHLLNKQEIDSMANVKKEYQYVLEKAIKKRKEMLSHQALNIQREY